ncbi:MAG: M48 family metalloprotease [Bacteroidetes bacterium]|jgi:predicted Zn-dependent protease|nr:M48 family metalloprotease [Bacteroidota bacterium]
MSSRHASSVICQQRYAHLAAAVIALVLALVTASCVVQQNPVSGRQRAYAYSWDQELRLGQEADQQIQAQFGVYDDEAVVAYVDSLGQVALAESHMRRPDTPEKFRETEFTFRVLDSPIVNAFALPGGYIYVTRGLLTHLNNEAQLVVVLGHEIGHVAARHASARAVTQQFTQIGLLVGGVAAGEFLGQTAGEMVLGLGSTAAQFFFLSYSRDNERESDDLGVEYAVRLGYDGAEGSAFFRSLARITEQAGGGIPAWQSTHPDPGERERRIPELDREWRERLGGIEERRDEQDRYLTAVTGTVMGQNPRQGFVDEDVFYHPDLAFRFNVPTNFRTQNEARQVVMQSSDQDAVMIFTFAQNASTAQEAGRNFAQQEGLTVVEEGGLQINNQRAYNVIADGRTQDGQDVRIQSNFIEYGDNVYAFIGYTLRQRFSDYAPRFRGAMRSFDELRDASILNIQPDRLQLVTTDRSAPFRTFVPDDLPRGLSAEDLAIINQVGLDDRIAAGRRLKLPGR